MWLCSFLSPKGKRKVIWNGIQLASFWIPVVPTTALNNPFQKHLQKYANWWMKFQLIQATSEQIWVCGKFISEQCNNFRDTSYSSENSVPNAPNFCCGSLLWSFNLFRKGLSDSEYIHFIHLFFDSPTMWIHFVKGNCLSVKW